MAQTKPQHQKQNPGLQLLPPNTPFKYRHVGSVQEDHREPIYCVTFNNFDLHHRHLFATVGQHRASIYRVLPGGHCDLLQVYEDADRGGRKGSGSASEGGDTGEKFFCCKWSRDVDSGAALLLLAGEKAVVRVLDVSRCCLVHTFAGHGKCINDLTVHPSRPHLFLSAADDESVRLWNIRSRTCVAIFAGEGGHRNKVLSLDFHPWDGHRFLSSGLDNAVKIWSLRPIERLIEESERAVEGCVGTGAWSALTSMSSRRAFPTRVVTQPLFSTMQMHGDYVDCVRWLGDLVMSKSVHDVIALWRPEGQIINRRPPPGASGWAAAAAAAAAASDEGRGGEGGGDEGSDSGAGLSVSGRLGGESVSNHATKILDFKMAESYRTWFVRFSCDVQYSVLACGSARGKVYVFSPLAAAAAVAASGGTPLWASDIGAPLARLTAPHCKVVVRQVAVSWDGTTILGACEDGSLHRWDREGSDLATDN